MKSTVGLLSVSEGLDDVLGLVELSSLDGYRKGKKGKEERGEFG